MLTEAELLERKTGIGASEVAAVFNLSPYMTPYELWLSKIDDFIDPQDTPRLRYGAYLENFILNEYALKTNRNNIVKDTALYRHPSLPYLITHIDGKAVGESILVEAKSTTSYSARNEVWGEEYSDKMPRHYLLQCAHEALVYSAATGIQIDRVDLAVWAEHELKIYRYLRNPQLENLIIKRCEEFWSLVENTIAPEATSYTDALNKYTDTVKDASVISSPYEDDLIFEIKEVKEQLKHLQEKESKLKAQLCERIQGCEVLVDYSGKIIATWKQIKSVRLNTQKLRDENAPLYEKYSTETSHRSLIIK